MPSDPIRSREAELRDLAAANPDGGAPPGLVENRRAVPRANYRSEEGEPDRGEWWTLAKAILIFLIVMAILGWLLTR